MHIRREEKVADSATHLYQLVNDIEAYPSFLPWCPKAEILGQAENEITARLTLARGGLHTTFTTRNVLVPDRQIDMHLCDGPFKRLHGIWTFTERPEGCTVALAMDFQIHGPWHLLGLPLVFSDVCNRMVHAFVVEANRRRAHRT